MNNRKHARRSLYLSLVSWLPRLTAICFLMAGWQNVRALGDEFTGAEFEAALSSNAALAAALDVGGSVVALAGLVFAVIATRKRQWGPALVAAWIFNLLGTFIASGVFIVG